MVRAFVLSVSLAVSAFAQQQTPTPPKPADDLPDTPSTTAQMVREATPNGPIAVIDTSMGRLTCRFFQKEAPVTVANFIGLAEGTKDWLDPVSQKRMHNTRFYDGTTFHRVIPRFMIQGGDRAGNGTGDPGYFFADEFTPALTFNQPGRLAMANSGPSTNGSQFFITEAPVMELNGKHTIFGQCDEHSVVVVQTIARVPTNPNDKPLTPVTINKVTIVPEGQPLPPDPMAPPAAAPSTPPTK
ncbi:peptidylprolyl isomerase [Terriglobus albidus]|uniref:peptidylprolyl isomerase n=1 Tax=Terriglobus albidus TaxID=1592106 RepID=UPI0021DFE0BC|nr:peptidylprolyl isomerase [Terriglobus albidus]